MERNVEAFQLLDVILKAATGARMQCLVFDFDGTWADSERINAAEFPLQGVP
jgi:hypothetical protein